MKTLILFYLVFSPLMASANNYDFSDSFGFENGSLRNWKLSRLSNPYAAKIINSPVRFGKYAASVTLGPGERYGDSWKSELSDPINAPFEKVIWYRVSHLLPGNFSSLSSSNSCVIAQWHNVSAPGVIGGSPPLAHLYSGDGKLKVFISYSDGPFTKEKDIKNKTFFTIPFRRGIWHDFVYRVIWSRRGKGSIDAWYNGKYMGGYRGKLGYPNDPEGPYFKTGVYCKYSPMRALTAYVDEYRRGSRYQDILLPGESLEGIK